MTRAFLCLEDGFLLEGESIGAKGESFGEVVFNTSMMGYQEILTDPSYKGQIVTMTYPHIGNYGVNEEDVESRKPYVEGFVVKELSQVTSNYRAQSSLEAYLMKHGIVGIQGVDTRALTKHLRTHGAKKGIISTVTEDPKVLFQKVVASPGLVGIDLVKEVTSREPYVWKSEKVSQARYHVVAIDYGIKQNILRQLAQAQCRVTVLPAFATAEEVLSHRPDGLFLSNGPGDPEAVTYSIETVRRLLGKLPIFGICLGHQILGLALGGKTFKLKFGHHGGNHPVLRVADQKVEITCQNHGFCVDLDSIPNKEMILTHVNLNDRTAEGMRHKKLPVFSVQYHPEASPGPHDSRYLFEEFVRRMSQ